MSFDQQAADYLSRETGIDPAFIEKDWHAVSVLTALSSIQHNNITPIFSGGTSLSKAHGLIKRFSEDLDFRVRFDSDTPPTRAQKRAFRETIIENLLAIEGLSFTDDDIEIHGLGFKIQLTYPKQFYVPDGLRPELQIEFSYSQPELQAETQYISSMIAEYKSEPGETSLLCLSPVEIAADKFSSLIWRVHKRDRSHPQDDPAMMRHLHDLCALQDTINKTQEIFIQTARNSHNTDQQRPSRHIDMSLYVAAEKAHNTMQTDELYEKEYEQFVDAVFYGSDKERIVFNMALEQFKELAGLFGSQ